MAEETKPGIPFSVGGPKHVKKTIVVEYTIGSYEGPEPPSDGIYEKSVPGLTFPDPGTPASGGEYKFEGLVAQLFRSGGTSSTDEYDVFIYDLDKTAETFGMRVQRTDKDAGWDDTLKSYIVFCYAITGT